MDDNEKADAVEKALQSRKPQDVFDGRELALLKYAEKLTLKPGQMEAADISEMRANGCDDGQILEANQIICYFNYVNRSLNGLGVTTENDTVGYYSGSADQAQA
jgi:alkylhydroperoxidase family enzyme